MSVDRYALALSALRFFCFSSELQLASYRSVGRTPPRYFFGDPETEADGVCDYFIGVACVFVTYVGSLYDKFDVPDNTRVADFSHLLHVWMGEPRVEWSEPAIRGEGGWARLRISANYALVELGEPLLDMPPKFDIETLINVDDFRTSGEARYYCL